MFEQAEVLARELKVSRSRLFVMALENFVREYQDRQLLDRINQACAAAPLDKTERVYLRRARRAHRRLVEGEW